MKLSFRITDLPYYRVCVNGGRKTFEIQALDGLLTVGVQYDFEKRPLEFKSEIALSDIVEILLFNHRIELYVNGILKDEEWPGGNCLFDISDEFLPVSDISAEEFYVEETEFQDVLSSFENAEGWYPGNGVFVGDCMPYKKDDEFHVLYLKDRHHHRSKWGLGAHQWEHISTKDFKTWFVHPMAVAITDPSEGSICTGSWIRGADKEYLYYTVRLKKGTPRKVLRSVSRDGYHFEKDTKFGFVISDKYDATTVRDPKVIMGDDGLYHMFLTTSLAKENKGCLAHYISQDLDNWTESDKPIYVAPGEAQPECPDYFKYNGKYYLIFSLDAQGYYMISDKPFDGFGMTDNPAIPCAKVPKCAPWEGRLIFVGYEGIDGYAGSMTFKAAKASDNGELVFEDM